MMQGFFLCCLLYMAGRQKPCPCVRASAGCECAVKVNVLLVLNVHFSEKTYVCGGIRGKITATHSYYTIAISNLILFYFVFRSIAEKSRICAAFAAKLRQRAAITTAISRLTPPGIIIC